MKKNTALIGAAFLMATSAIGPGFLTQTTFYTEKLLASFGFVILLSVLLDIGAQLTIWRTITLAGKRAQDVANEVIPYSGYVLSVLVVMGGLAFNIGNIAGTGMGINVLSGIDVRIGACMSAVVATLIFVVQDAGKVIDYFARILGIFMLVLIVYVVYTAHPPVADALQRTFLPTSFDAEATITLVGGTVGGYITFAGAHRLIDAGITGERNLKKVTQSASTGIMITALLRYFLFLATLGVLTLGNILDATNPPASVFGLAAGKVGYLLFGLVIWSAAITSVVGAAYTSMSFLKTLHPTIEKYQSPLIIIFIWFSTLVFVIVGKPVKTLLFVGLLNGFILPIGLALMLLAARQPRIVGNLKTPLWLQLIGWSIVGMMTILSVMTLFK